MFLSPFFLNYLVKVEVDNLLEDIIERFKEAEKMEDQEESS